MKIITNNVELHEQIFNLDENTMKDMEGKLEGVTREAANELCPGKLKTESIYEIPNGIINGFRETIDKPTLLTNGSSDFEEISDDDLHLELEASDEENRSEEIVDSLSFSKKEFISHISADSETNLIQSNPVEIIDVLNMPVAETTKVEFVPKNSNKTEREVLAESDCRIIKVDSLLDCRKNEELSSDDDKEEKSDVENCLNTTNSNITENAMEVNVVFSEIIIENSETNLNSKKVEDSNLHEDLCKSDLNKLNLPNKTAIIEMSLDCDKTEVNKISLEESLPIKKISESHLNECFMEVDKDSNSLCTGTPKVDSACSVQTSQNTSTLINTDNDVLMIPAVLNSSERDNSFNTTEEKTLDKLVLDANTKSVELGSEDNAAMEIDENNPSQITLVIDTTENKDLPLEFSLNKHTFNNDRPKLTKSSSGEEISLSDVLESVKKNVDEQNNSFLNDELNNIVLFSPVGENNHVSITEGIDLPSEKLSTDEDKTTQQSSQESGNTINNPEDWIVLDEINESFSSSDEQTATTSNEIKSSSNTTTCNVTDQDNMEVIDSLNILQSEVTGSNDNKDTQLVKDNESKQFDNINDCDKEYSGDECNADATLSFEEGRPGDRTNGNATLSVEENASIILRNEKVSDLCNTGPEVIQCSSLSDEGKQDVRNEESVSKESEEMCVENEEEDIYVGQVDPIVSDNEKNNDLNVENPVVREDNSIELVNENHTAENISVSSNKALQKSFEEKNKDNVLLLESAEPLKHSKQITEPENVSFEVPQTNDNVKLDDSNKIGHKFQAEEQVSTLLNEELTSKNENKENCLVSIPRSKTPEYSLEFGKECEIEESKQSNKDIHSTLGEKDNLKQETTNSTNGVSLGETTKEIKKEDVSAPARKRSASIVDEFQEAETKRVKSRDEVEFSTTDNLCDSKQTNLTESSVSKLKRTSDHSLQNDVVKKPKLSSDESKNLTACADVLEVCVKFAEINASVCEKLKEKVCKDSNKIVPEKIHNDSDVNYIRNILKNSIDTVDNPKSEKIKSNKKSKRKEIFDGEATSSLNNSKKLIGSNKLQPGKVQVSQRNITNLDLAIERVVEDSKTDPEKKIPLLKKFHKEQLKNLTRHDLEELVVVKLCEAITDRSTIGELRLRCSKVEMAHDQWRKKVLQLEKSHRELEMVLKRYLQEASNTKKERQPLPIKVTRSVGLQVVLASTPSVRQKSNISGNSSSQPSSLQRRQHSMSNKAHHSSTQKPSTSTVPGTSKSPKTSFNHAVPEQTQSGIKVLTPKNNKVDLQSPVNSPVAPRSTPTPASTSTSTSTTPVTPVAQSPKANNLEVIDLTDKEEKSKQLQQTKQQQMTQQQQQQQKLKQQLMQQQQQQKQKQQLLQQKQQQYQQQKQSAHQNQQQVKQPTQQNQIKQPSPIQNNVQKQLPPPKPQQSQHQQNIVSRVPTSVPQNGIRVVQTHQLTSTPTQGMAILVPTAGQNGIARSSHLLIATSTPNQIRTSVPVIQPVRPATSTAPINIGNNSTVMLRHGQVIPIQQSNPGILRSPPSNTLPLLKPRTGIQQVRHTLQQPVFKHPAPLPLNPQHPMKPGTKLPPPKPQLKIAKTVNGIMLSWSMALTKDIADIVSYQLFAYQESSQPPNTALWKKVGDVKALPLPMACTLTQFVEGHKYHFSVRAVDVHSRIGPFSVPGSILLTSAK